MSVRRKKSGGRLRWEAVVELGTDPTTSKRKQTSKLFDTRREAQAWERERQAKADAGGRIVRERRTVAMVLDTWLESIAPPQVKPSTYAMYENTVTVHLKPALGHIAVARLTPEHVQRFYAAKLKKGMSPATLRLCHLRLRQALEMARKHGYVGRNIMADVDRIREPYAERPTWSVAEVRTFLATARTDAYWPIWRFLLETGVREGEALALSWVDTDMEGRMAHVRRTQHYLKGQFFYGTPKTGKPRTVRLSAALVAVLREHRARQLAHIMAHRDTWDDHGLVFATRVGTPIPPSSLWRNYAKLVRAARVPRIRIHDLRHTSVTLAFDVDGHSKDVSRRVGHGSDALTLNRYAHGTEEQDIALAERLGALLEGDETPLDDEPDTPQDEEHKEGNSGGA